MKAAFSPIITSDTRFLILGTIPSEESLSRQEYYGNSRNQFWRIMQSLFGVPLPAAQKIHIMH